MLPREQALVLGLPKHQIEDLDDRAVLDQTFTVHAEDGGPTQRRPWPGR